MKRFLLLAMMFTTLAGGASATTKALDYSVIGLYDDVNYSMPNYFVQLSDDESAKYDPRAGKTTITTGYVLQLDLYNVATSPAAVIPGTYTAKPASADLTAETYDADFSELSYYADGKLQGAASRLTAPVVITSDDNGVYTVTTTATDPVTNEPLDLSFTGRLPMKGVNDKPSSFTQLRKDLLDVELDMGGIAYYQGVSEYSRNGGTYINLYSANFNESGGLTEDGINLAMLVSHKPFVKKPDFQIVPGTYTSATTLERDTWYPCREIDYTFGSEVISVPFGSYIRIRQNDEYVYGYLKTGTFAIDVDENGDVSGTLDAYTDLGYHVTATFCGPMALNTDNATFQVGVSNLVDDVDLDFSKLEKGYIYHTGLTGGCRTFIVHLGSTRDPEIDNGGDMMRLEFLAPTNTAVLRPGMYSVVPVRWNEYELQAGGTYEPMSLNKGYFDNMGAMIGTRYAHNEEGRYCVWDFAAPAESGTVKVETDDYINYRFDINIIDDIGFEIRGQWDKPLQYMYDRDALEKEMAGIELPAADAESALGVAVDGRDIIVLNAGAAAVSLFDTNGRGVAAGNAAEVLDASSLPAGIYILSVNNQSFKIVLK